MKIKILEIINNEIKGKKILHRDDDGNSSWRAVGDIWHQINGGFSAFYSEDSLVAGYYSGSARFVLANHLIIIIMFGDDGHPTPLNGFRGRISARTGWNISDFSPEVLAELEYLDPSTIKPVESPTEPIEEIPETIAEPPIIFDLRERIRLRAAYLNNTARAELEATT